ncbi:MAG: hypothetical protein Tsb0034_28380 [Ekhidna sp.]
MIKSARFVFFTFLISVQLSYGQEIDKGYQLVLPDKKEKAVLLLFGGFPENADRIRKEFKIEEEAKANGVAVVFMNYNRKLWLENSEKEELAILLIEILNTNNLATQPIFIGGFSSGGNIAFLISDYLVRNDLLSISGAFLIDSPIDLSMLYRNAQKNLERGIKNEAQWLIGYFDQSLGPLSNSQTSYSKHSVFDMASNTVENISALKGSKIRLYTEPDTTWWKENRMAEYEDLNAYQIKSMAEALDKKWGFTDVEYISTENKGYRASGERHPHSWSIVDPKELIKWIKE